MPKKIEKPGMVLRKLTPEKQSSFFLFGSRGVGKSHWIKSSFPNSLHLDLLKPTQFKQLLHNPEYLIELVEGEIAHNKNFHCVTIDEVQKIPELLNVVHSLMETYEHKIQFVLSGSSSRKLKLNGVDLLGGRALIKKLHPFLPSELGKNFDFNRALQYGLIPLIWSSTKPAHHLQAYIGLYLKEEVKAEGLVQNLTTFSLFLEVMSLSQAQLVNAEAIARDVHVDRKSIQRYIEILEDIYLAFQLTVFSKRAQRDLVTKKKFYYFDCGLYKYLRPKGPLDSPSEISGTTFETLIAQCLRAYLDYNERPQSLWYWRTTKGIEVDFVVYDEFSFLAIDVKNAVEIRSKDLDGLNLFSKDYPEAKLILIYRGKNVIKKQNILCIPGEKFLLELDQLLKN